MHPTTLKSIPLFKDLGEKDLELIATSLERRTYAKGETIFRQGDIGDAMYLIESGQVVVWDEKAGEALAYLGPGSFVGEIALLLAEPRSATLKVAIDAELYILKKDAFAHIIKERPAIAVYMSRELSQRLVETSKQRFKPRAKRISALWGMDGSELVGTINEHVQNAIAVIPLPGCVDFSALKAMPDVYIVSDPELTAENLAGKLGIQVEVFSHILILLPTEINTLALKTLSLSDTVISIGTPPRWIQDNVGQDKLWETRNEHVALSRIARRLTGHTVGVALSSGGGKGLAHLGAMKVLRDENIPVDMIAGTSAGAFFGIFFAVGWDDARFNTFADEIQTLNRWVNWDISIPPRAGVLKGAKAKDIIARLVEHKRFEDLDIPFYCVAADILTGEEIVFDSGDLANAIRASLSIPMLANPWLVNNRYLIDGAFVDPIPAKLLREKGADIVIASSVIQPLTSNGAPSAHPSRPEQMPHFLKVITNIQNIVENQLVNFQLNAIDVMIHTPVRVDHALDFKHAREIIAAGEAAARQQLPAIRACLAAVHQD